ncbi:MAG: hypothetical protein MUO26_00910 [Methanotrichaceae archaeon]|nr:hypothetical protein [Methanotrichaceae archaeon]
MGSLSFYVGDKEGIDTIRARRNYLYRSGRRILKLLTWFFNLVIKNETLEQLGAEL